MRVIPYFLRSTYWISDYLKGSPVNSHYNDVQRIMEDHLIGVDCREYHLNNLLVHACRHSPFYKEYQSRVLRMFPVVNKSILRANYGSIKVDPDKIPHQKGSVYIQKTSGSTGTPFAVPQDTRKRNRRVAELKYFGMRVGFKSHDRLVHLRTWNRWQKKSCLQSVRENIVPFDITRINDERLKELCNIIKNNKNVVLRGYASSIDLLVRFCIDKNIDLSNLKLIIAGSESLQEGTRYLVNNYIGCHLISQYANEENGILGQEELCGESDSPFYLNHASYIFEILQFDNDNPVEYGKLGRIVITDLFNYAFPLIRYDTGDTGVMEVNWQNSNGYPVISKLYGRRLDLVFDTSGNVVYPMAIARILKQYLNIVQWQFIQTNKSKYILMLVVREMKLNHDEIAMELLNLFGVNAEIDIRYTDDIPVLDSGKRKAVVNNWII